MRTTYSYNVNNQLTAQRNGEEERTYTYDGRGNLTAVSRGEELLQTFTYDTANRMSGAVQRESGVEKHIKYKYNAFGKRTELEIFSGGSDNGIPGTMHPGRITLNRKIHYTTDLTREYHNLLLSESEEEQEKQIFYWDGNVSSMEEEGRYSFYLQDELGSPMRFMDEQGGIRETYGFDEFGRSLVPDLGQQMQPFGYTGYQMEETEGLYYAQARRYDAQVGRFVSEDKIKGNGYLPMTINAYLYCRNNPLIYVDPSGNDCYYFYLPEWENEAENDSRQLAKIYGLKQSEVHTIEITDNQSLIDAWNGMGVENGAEVDIDAVVINTHANPESLGYGNNSDDTLTGSDIQALNNQSMDKLILYGCNARHADHIGTNPASEFSQKVNGAPVLASDGTVKSGTTFFNLTKRKYLSDGDDVFKWYVPEGIERDNYGWLIYQYTDDNLEVVQNMDMEMKMSITSMIEGVNDYVCFD